MPLPSPRIVLRTHKLPALLLREIGRLITVFSCIEHEMNHIAYSLLGLSPAEGRLALAMQNVRSRWHLISLLLDINEISVTHNLGALSKEVQELEEVRDWVAHGVWSNDNGVPHLQISRGTWQPKGSHKGVDRKIIPAAAPFDQHALREISSVAVDLLTVIEDTHKQIVAKLQPLPGKHTGLRRPHTKPPQRPRRTAPD